MKNFEANSVMSYISHLGLKYSVFHRYLTGVHPNVDTCSTPCGLSMLHNDDDNPSRTQ